MITTTPSLPARYWIATYYGIRFNINRSLRSVDVFVEHSTFPKSPEFAVYACPATLLFPFLYNPPRHKQVQPGLTLSSFHLGLPRIDDRRTT